MGSNRTLERHLAAIRAGEVTKSNVAGLKRALNAQARRELGYSVSSTAPKPCDPAALQREVRERQPRVVGTLHDSGVKLLRSPRYAKRWNADQRETIAQLDHFLLVDFVWDRLNCQPVYKAVARDGGAFSFFNVPWQSGGDGPQLFA